MTPFHGLKRSLPLLALFTITLLTACEDPSKRKNSSPESSAAQKWLKGGELKFSDDFERKEIGENYRSDSQAWTLDSGQIHVQGARNAGLWLKEKLPERARIEFDARSESAEGDLKVEVFANKPEHEGGYVIIFGGWKNQLNVIARLDEHGSDRREQVGPKVETGKTYRFAIVKANNKLSWFLDGKLIMTYPDPKDIKGRFFGFNNWETPVYFDNLKVYALD